MVTHDTQDNLYTLLLQRYEILLTVVEQMLHVLVVVVVHLTGLSVVVDVTREEDNLVDNQLTRLLQSIAEVVQGVSVVNLHTAYYNLILVRLVTVGHTGDVLYEEDKLALLYRSLGE